MSGLEPRPVTLAASALPTELTGQPIENVPVLVLMGIMHLVIVTLVT